ncbi:MAG: zinc-binding alcohol dehydrogenase family protein [Xanthobacteraceae bacterium]|nr:zinc-binding alcohol dehydrogenase family protein [Xanthobacteraceae bacterium]
MKAAMVAQAGSMPVYGDFREPVASGGERRIAVKAAALSPVVKGRASGAHYSAPGAFPFVVGIDGVGRLDDGRRVYFILPGAPFGSMAEWAVVPSSQCVSLADGIDDLTAAAIANPGLSSWAALKDRAKLKTGETVLINGATGTSGRLAVQVAKHLGAKKVIATGRNPASLQSLKALGADETIQLVESTDALDAAFKQSFAGGVDVVLDYLWGRSAERLLIAGTKAGKEDIPIRFVQVGNSSGANITLPASVLRSAPLEMMGSGIGSLPLDRIVGVIDELLQAAAKTRFRIETETMPLSEIGRAWPGESCDPRVVFTVGA